MRVLELFSGYGTASFALKRLGIDYELVGYSDIDKYANQCFKQNHCPDDIDDKLRLGDVTKVDEKTLPDFDLLTGGFPCQAFSVAGRMQGEADPRGTLFYEIIRIAEHKQPKYMLLENVKGLTTKKFKDTFDKILGELDRIGYYVYWKILNTKDYGIPQNRERVWFVCMHKDLVANPHIFNFPEKEELKLFLKNILEEEVDEKYNLTQKQIKHLVNHINKRFKLDDDGCINCLGTCFGRIGSSSEELEIFRRTNNAVIKRIQFDISGKGYNSQQDRAYFSNGLMCCLPNANPINKLNIIELIDNGFIFRRLTPKEAFRCQGFLNDDVNLENISDTQAYNLAGNGQSVNVVEKIFKEMFK